MRRVVRSLALIGLLAAIFPAAVAAAPPVRVTDWQTGILCELTSEAGFVGVFVEVRPSGGFADVAIWAPDANPSSDPPTIVTANGTASLDGSRLTANFDLVLAEDPEKAAGSARLSSELLAAGPEQDFGSRDLRDGNRLMRLEQTLQLLSADGALALHLFDGTYDEVHLGPCGASTLSSSFFGTNPNAYLTSTEQVFVSCEWATASGTVELLAIADDFMVFSAVTIVERDQVLIGLAVPLLTATTYEATYDLFDPAGGSEAVGSAAADAMLSPSGDRITEQDWVDPHRFNVVGEGLAADGTLSLSFDGKALELAMDDTSCDAGDVRVQVMEKMPRG